MLQPWIVGNEYYETALKRLQYYKEHWVEDLLGSFACLACLISLSKANFAKAGEPI